MQEFNTQRRRIYHIISVVGPVVAICAVNIYAFFIYMAVIY